MIRKANQVKFYADTPDGKKNKLFTFTAHNINHSLDIAAKFIQEKNFKIRAAYYINANGISIRIDNMINLETHKNSLTEEQLTKNNLLKYKFNVTKWRQ
jgi:hypothetical protein